MSGPLTRRPGAWLALALIVSCSDPAQRYGEPEGEVSVVSHKEYQALLGSYVGSDGAVDYARWQATPGDVARLDSYLAQVTHASPDNRPDLFTAPADRLSYWINLYNALVLREVIRRWPLESVRQVKGGAISYVVPGRGFFSDLRFAVGGKSLSLDDIEHEILRGRFADARIHFALNCGSSSCPVLRQDAFDAAALEGQLEDASLTFINNAANVAVDHGKKTIHLSKIFDWYSDDFIAHARRVSPGSSAKAIGMVDFLLLYARGTVAEDLARARAGSYAIAHRDYDWSVNAGETPAAGAEPASATARPGGSEAPGRGSMASADEARPFPDLTFTLLDGTRVRAGDLAGKVVLIDFWASYCKPCRASFPAIEALWQTHEERGLMVIAVSQDEDRALSERFVEDTKVTFPIALDPEQKATEAPLEVRSLPTEIVLDRPRPGAPAPRRPARYARPDPDHRDSAGRAVAPRP